MKCCFNRIVPRLGGTVLGIVMILNNAGIRADAQYRPALTKQSVWSVSNKVTQVDGKDFFPIGIYYISFYTNQDAQRLLDLEKIAANGFNMIATPIKLTDKPFLDKAAQLGVHTMIEFNDDPASVMAMAQGHPTRSLFLAFDDVDQVKSDGSRVYSVSQVATETSKLKAQIPGALTFITAFSTARSKDYMGYADVYCYQVYPIPDEPESSVSYNLKLHLASDTLYPSQVPLGCLQSYQKPNQRVPTKLEHRSMTYQGLVLGIKGLMYYAFYDYTTNLNNNPDLWAEMGRVNREVDSLKGFFLRGQRTALSTGNSQVYAAQFTWNGRTIVVAVNAFGSNSYPITLRPTVTATSARNVFPSRPGTLSLQNGALVGTLGPKTVSVYELATSTSTGGKTLFSAPSSGKTGVSSSSKRSISEQRRARALARKRRLARIEALRRKRLAAR